MAQELSELFADLDSAKADLARSVRRCQLFFGEGPLPPVTRPDDPKGAFDWSARRS